MITLLILVVAALLAVVGWLYKVSEFGMAFLTAFTKGIPKGRDSYVPGTCWGISAGLVVYAILRLFSHHVTLSIHGF